jgi:hypothetical protein
MRTPLATYGVLEVLEGPLTLFKCITLELPWKDNERRVSCIPPGAYPMDFEYSNRFQRELWELKEVPDRSEVKIHPANYVEQLHGCIALGSSIQDINGDGVADVTNSRVTVDRFHKVLKDEKSVYIIVTDPNEQLLPERDCENT